MEAGGGALGAEFAAYQHSVARIKVEEVVERASEAVANEQVINVLPCGGVAEWHCVRYGY